MENEGISNEIKIVDFVQLSEDELNILTNEFGALEETSNDTHTSETNNPNQSDNISAHSTATSRLHRVGDFLKEGAKTVGIGALCLLGGALAVVAGAGSLLATGFIALCRAPVALYKHAAFGKELKNYEMLLQLAQTKRGEIKTEFRKQEKEVESLKLALKNKTKQFEDAAVKNLPEEKQKEINTLKNEISELQTQLDLTIINEKQIGAENVKTDSPLKIAQSAFQKQITEKEDALKKFMKVLEEKVKESLKTELEILNKKKEELDSAKNNYNQAEIICSTFKTKIAKIEEKFKVATSISHCIGAVITAPVWVVSAALSGISFGLFTLAGKEENKAAKILNDFVIANTVQLTVGSKDFGKAVLVAENTIKEGIGSFIDTSGRKGMRPA